MFDAKFFEQVLPDLLSEYMQQRNLESVTGIITTACLSGGKEIEFVIGRWTSEVIVFLTADDRLELVPFAEITRIEVRRRPQEVLHIEIAGAPGDIRGAGGESDQTLPYLSPIRVNLPSSADD